MKFYLGAHRPGWLGTANVPLFVSHRQLAKVKRLPRAIAPWSLDSGAFSEISQHGRWTFGPATYIEAVARYREEIGNLDWAAPMDVMCEPWIREISGLTVRESQERTVQSYLDLRNHGPFIPALQGWDIEDYQQCVALYESAGVDLRALPVVGLGSVCRRQSRKEIGEIVRSLQPLKLHGFGVKIRGLEQYGDMLESADSMAWSFGARFRPPLAGCQHRGSCSNCLRYALQWRAKVIRPLNQCRLF
jgi:hypothetical protein